MTNWMDESDALAGMAVREVQLDVITSETAGSANDRTIAELLNLLREKVQMEVVFVAEFTDGKRVFRHVDEEIKNQTIHPGQWDPLEMSYCQRIVDGRLPLVIPDTSLFEVPKLALKIGSYLAAPVILIDGCIYGTLCCFSSGIAPHLGLNEQRNLEMSAKLVARKLPAHPIH